MAMRRGGVTPAKPPPYVLQWVGRRVTVWRSDGACDGVVTNANRKRVVDHNVTYLHVALDNGLLWIGNTTQVSVRAERTTNHKELDAYGR